jgi:nucleotide-binding universal stress UspA family protein
MKIEKILFATKFRELAFESLKALFPLKGAGAREIILLYVIPREAVGFVPFGGYLKEEEERLRGEARLRFEDWQAAIKDAGLASRIIIEIGETVPKILSVARREEADLIVAGKKKIGQMEKFFIGSDTHEILVRSPVPVLVNKYMVEYERDGERLTRINDRIFENPFVALDWSAHSERAFELLLSLRGAVTRAGLVHVIAAKELAGLDEKGFEAIKAKEKEKLALYAKRLESAGIKSETHLLAGDPAAELLMAAREFGASLIIMGTAGKGRLEEFFLGSVSHETAERSEIPVLLVP